MSEILTKLTVYRSGGFHTIPTAQTDPRAVLATSLFVSCSMCVCVCRHCFENRWISRDGFAQKGTLFHYLLIFMLFQTCMSLYFLLNIQPSGQFMCMKTLVYPKMKITPWFTLKRSYSRCIWLSSRSYINKCPGSSKLYNGSEWVLRFLSPIKCIHPSL